MLRRPCRRAADAVFLVGLVDAQMPGKPVERILPRGQRGDPGHEENQLDQHEDAADRDHREEDAFPVRHG